MAQIYNTVTSYVSSIRNRLQDLIGPPYRYSDEQIVDALNIALEETQRIRPDIFLDLKYQGPLSTGDLDDGFIPLYYTTADIRINSDGSYDVKNGTVVPIPSKYNDPIIWYMGGHLQFFDVEDTQDQRAVAFKTVFMQRLVSNYS